MMMSALAARSRAICLPFWLGEVELQQSLVAVPHDVIRRLRSATGRGTGERADLDDVRAEVAEHPRAERAREHVGEVEHANPVERSRHQSAQPISSRMSWADARVGSLGSPPIEAGVSTS